MKCEEERVSIVSRSCRISIQSCIILVGYNHVILGGIMSNDCLTQSPIHKLDAVHYLIFNST